MSPEFQNFKEKQFQPDSAKYNKKQTVVTLSKDTVMAWITVRFQNSSKTKNSRISNHHVISNLKYSEQKSCICKIFSLYFYSVRFFYASFILVISYHLIFMPFMLFSSLWNFVVLQKYFVKNNFRSWQNCCFLTFQYFRVVHLFKRINIKIYNNQNDFIHLTIFFAVRKSWNFNQKLDKKLDNLDRVLLQFVWFVFVLIFWWSSITDTVSIVHRASIWKR